MSLDFSTRAFGPDDQPEVVSLWQRCGLTRPWNDPHLDIARKATVQPELFRVGVLGAGGPLVATAMAGYDGHRGWVNYLAVDPAHRRRGHAVAMLAEVERMLTAMGCPKLNLQIRASNHDAIAFYRRIGYLPDEALSYGKRLIVDGPRAAGA